MRLAIFTMFAVLGLSFSSSGHMGGDPGAPEVKGALKCDLQPATSNLTAGSRVWMHLTIENTSAFEAELPFPGSAVPGMLVKVFLVSRQATGDVERAILPTGYGFDAHLTPEQRKQAQDVINATSGFLMDERPYFPCVVLPGNTTTEQQKAVEGMPTDTWKRAQQDQASWISLPPRGRAEFQVFVEMRPKEGKGEAQPLSPGICRLLCAVMYDAHSLRPEGVLTTNASTSAKEIANAKASGLSLLAEGKLWTGKMESNIVSINVIESPK